MTIRKVLEDSEYRANVQLWELLEFRFVRDTYWDDTIPGWTFKNVLRLTFQGWIDAAAAGDGGTQLKTITVEFEGPIGDPSMPLDQAEWDAIRAIAYDAFSTHPDHGNFAEGEPGYPPGEVVTWVYD